MTDRKRNKKFDTRAIQSGHVDGDETGAVATPIYPSSTYRVDYPGDVSGYVYSRSANPTRAALERALATLENGHSGYAFASGLAALDAVFHLLKSGDHVVAVDDLYGGTHRQFERLMNRFGVAATYVDGREASNFSKAIKENTRLFWIETPTNPLLKITDIAAVTSIAREHDILSVVDNTFATPYLQRPIELGADIAMHSLSKYIGGHCDVIGGALVVKDAQLAEKVEFAQNAVGSVLGPFDSWIVLRGIKTLAIRMERHSFNAGRIAEYLQTVDLVETVFYPGLSGSALPNGMSHGGGIVSFNLKAGFEAVKAFAMATEIFILAESLGGVESLINHPASMTHASIPKEIREPMGVTDGLIRLSVGLEHIDDLLEDLQSAFDVIAKSAQLKAK